MNVRALFSLPIALVLASHHLANAECSTETAGATGTPGFEIEHPASVAISKADADAGNFTTLLQDTIANADRGTTIHLPSGTYFIDDTIDLKDGVRIQGKGTSGTTATILTLRQTACLDEYEDLMISGQAMVRGDGVTNVGLSKLVLDVNSQNHDSFEPPVASAPQCLKDDTAHGGIALVDVSHSEFTDVVIRNFGRTSVDPGGQGLLLGATKIMANDTGGVSVGNLFQDVQVKDVMGAAMFGVRFISDWLVLTEDDEYPVVVADNVIRGGMIRGGMWNGLEVAGPGTRYNTAEGISFQESRLTAFESDKGAKLNLFSGNVVTSLVRSVTTGGEVLNTGVYVMRDQGYPEKRDRNPQRFAEGNEYKGLIYLGNPGAADANSNGRLTGMIRAARSRCLRLHDNNAVLKTSDNWGEASIITQGRDDDEGLPGHGIPAPSNACSARGPNAGDVAPCQALYDEPVE